MEQKDFVSNKSELLNHASKLEDASEVIQKDFRKRSLQKRQTTQQTATLEQKEIFPNKTELLNHTSKLEDASQVIQKAFRKRRFQKCQTTQQTTTMEQKDFVSNKSELLNHASKLGDASEVIQKDFRKRSLQKRQTTQQAATMEQKDFVSNKSELLNHTSKLEDASEVIQKSFRKRSFQKRQTTQQAATMEQKDFVSNKSKLPNQLRRAHQKEPSVRDYITIPLPRPDVSIPIKQRIFATSKEGSFSCKSNDCSAVELIETDVSSFDSTMKTASSCFKKIGLPNTRRIQGMELVESYVSSLDSVLKSSSNCSKAVEISKAKKVQDEMESMLDYLRGEIFALQRENTDLKDEMYELNEEKKGLAHQIQLITLKSELPKSTIKQLHSKNDLLQRKIESLQDENSGNVARINVLNEGKSTLNRKLNTTTSEAEHLKKEMARLQSQTATLQKQSIILKRENLSLDERRCDLIEQASLNESQVQLALLNLEKLREKNIILEEQIETLQNKNSKENEIRQNRIGELKTSIVQRKRIGQLQRNNTALIADIIGRKQDVLGLKRELKTQNEGHGNELRRIITKYESQIGLIKGSTSREKNEIESLRLQLRQERLDHCSEVSQLKNLLTNAKDNHHDYLAKLTDVLETRHADREREKEELVQELHRVTVGSNTKVDKLQREVDSLKSSQISEIRNLCADLKEKHAGVILKKEEVSRRNLERKKRSIQLASLSKDAAKDMVKANKKPSTNLLSRINSKTKPMEETEIYRLKNIIKSMEEIYKIEESSSMDFYNETLKLINEAIKSAVNSSHYASRLFDLECTVQSTEKENKTLKQIIKDCNCEANRNSNLFDT